MQLGCAFDADVLDGNMAELTSASRRATWLFCIIVAALLLVVGLSVFVVVAWSHVDGSRRGCLLSRLLSAIVDRFSRRKPETAGAATRPTPAAEERFRLRSPQVPVAEPAIVGSCCLTVPTMPDSAASTTTTSDGSSGRPLLNPAKQRASLDDTHQ